MNLYYGEETSYRYSWRWGRGSARMYVSRQRPRWGVLADPDANREPDARTHLDGVARTAPDFGADADATYGRYRDREVPRAGRRQAVR